MTISDNYQRVQQRIHDACTKSQRSLDSVRLLAVSKTKPLSAVMAAYALGQHDFGENYLQDALEKIRACPSALDKIQWHFIGAVQSNKTKTIAENFAWVHTLERKKIAQRLHDQRPSHLPPLNVLIQINISREANKAGISLEQLPALAEYVQQLPNLALKGLMCIPATQQQKDVQQQTFHAMAEARDKLITTYPQAYELSMGMSGDLDLSIHCGATIVRIGTDIFGAREV